jgi:putative chitinase
MVDLNACRKVGVDDAELHEIMPYARPADRSRFLGPINECMLKWSITTPLRAAHFLAQIGHESGCLRYVQEIASGEAYEGRRDLGNTQPGDGRRFKGRGLIQLTGRSNYTAYGRQIGVDLLADPTIIATDPTLAVDVAGWFWSIRELNRYADVDDVEMVTRRVNGGLNGIADRRAFLARAKQVFRV